MIRKNILVAQGGGPTMVINQSLIGILEESTKKQYMVLGSLNGVNGIINSKFKNLSRLSQNSRNFIASSPGAALGSTRDKPDKDYCLEILENLKNKKIEKFFYIGGNDSSDSLKIISNEAKIQKYELQCIHVPKTIDNDLVFNDHTPGYGSAAKYIASVFAGINLDVNSLPGVYLGIVMGRHAGFLTAASSLLKKNHFDGPHLIYLPESKFELNVFLKQIKSVYNKYGKCIVAISEGIQDKNRELITKKISKTEKDAHGNVQLSGSGILGDYLVKEIKENLQILRVRADTFGYPQRSFLGCISEVDQREARMIGRKAVKFSHLNKESFSVSIEERKEIQKKYNINYSTNNLDAIAGKTKLMPNSFIDHKNNFVTSKFKKYALPLIGKKIPPFTTSF